MTVIMLKINETPFSTGLLCRRILLCDFAWILVTVQFSDRVDSLSVASYVKRSPGGGGGGGKVLPPKKWVGMCGPLPKTLTLFMSSLQAN